MTIAHVQSTNSFTSVSSSLSSCAFGAPVTAGNFLVAGIRINSTAQSGLTVTDSLGNLWTKCSSAQNTGNHEAFLFYAQNVVGGNSTVQIHAAASVGVFTIVSEYSGIDPTAAFDTNAAANSGTSSSPATAIASSTTAASLFYAFCANRNSSAETWAAGTGWTIRNKSTSANAPICAEDQIVASTLSTTATWTYTNSEAWSACLAVFRGASGTATPVINPFALPLTGAQ
jgi:hypothetical protein